MALFCFDCDPRYVLIAAACFGSAGGAAISAPKKTNKTRLFFVLLGWIWRHSLLAAPIIVGVAVTDGAANRR